MRITISTQGVNGAGLYTLAGLGHQKGPSNFKINGSRVAQGVFPVRADSAKFYNRKQKHSRITFRVYEAFPNPYNAEKRVLEVSGPLDGNLLTVTAQYGPSSRVYYVPNAVVESVGAQHIGALVIIDYQIIGGAPQGAAPTGEQT